jgi:hypothetical protein
VNVELASGAAVSVTSVPSANGALQVAPQSIPEGLLVTVPLPVPDVTTCRSKGKGLRVIAIPTETGSPLRSTGELRPWKRTAPCVSMASPTKVRAGPVRTSIVTETVCPAEIGTVVTPVTGWFAESITLRRTDVTNASTLGRGVDDMLDPERGGRVCDVA